jgi:hypothetical protein
MRKLFLAMCCAAALGGCGTARREVVHTERSVDAEIARVCRANLREMQSIKQHWAAAEHKTTNDTPAWSDLMKINRYLVGKFECGAGGVYDWGRVGERAKCSVHGE